jgi:hypothetical protein
MSGTANSCGHKVTKYKVKEKEGIKVEERVTEGIKDENRDRIK